ncbi:efflux RND transporter permease subunit [Thiomicrorhabdus sp. Milos-T2]|uniref:efflux RND transporter permease subunit n=1 Tax=Thiomicrorhabdus sp. Milos-T2 TaxID=90814 RepID=UPI0004944BA3|nr:efflux RND transporter permease subunit [Thiomicrorhabdus sp. Milos-T2]
MNFAHWVSAHRRSILFLFAILVIAGAFSLFKMPQGMFPNINFPRISVAIETGDQPADQMVIDVTRKLEQALRPIPGVQSIRSTTSRGSAETSINFKWGQNMQQVLLQVESAVNQVLPNLPPGTTFTVRRMDPTVFPVIAYSLTSKKLSQIETRDIAQQELIPLLSSIDGVTKIKIMGGDTEEYRVDVNPSKLNAFGMAFSDVVKALSAANVLQAVGRLEDHYKLYLTLSDTRLQNLESLENTVIKSGNNGFVRLADIANIHKDIKPSWLKTSANGEPATFLLVYQQPKSNAVNISHEIEKRLSGYQNKLPPSLHISKWYDQSELVVSSSKSVTDAILIGVVLAAFILMVFLRNIKVAMIALLMVPASLAITSLLLYLLGASFNIMTLGGMAAAVGLIVDDGIVMIEHLVKRIRQKNEANEPLAFRLREAAVEFTKPLAGSSAATIIIFIPLAFLAGVTGAFFQALSITMATALLSSFLMAWLAVPLLAEHLLREKDANIEDSGRIFTFVQNQYHTIMHKLFAKPAWLLAGLIPLILLGGYSYKQVGSGFMPHMDEGGFILDYVQQPGTSLTEGDRVVNQIEKIIVNNPAVDTYSSRLGGQLGGGITESNQGDMFIKLKPFPRPPIDQVMSEIRNQIAAKVPGVEVETALLMEDVIGDLTAVPQPIEIKLYGDNFKSLIQTADKVAKAIASVKGVVEIKNGVVQAGDAITVKVDRDKAAIEGMSPENITTQINQWLTGIVTTKIQKGIKMIGVRVWTPKSSRQTIEDIAKLTIRAPDGHLFPLSRVASIKAETGQPQITRENLKKMIAVTARIEGRDMGSTISDIKQVLKQPNLLPHNIYYELGGLYKQQQIAFKGLIAVFIAAIALIFLLLLFLYEDFAAAIAILCAPLLATGMVFTGLWVTSMELNITAMMGMTMIIGIVTEVSIFYFSEYQALLKQNFSIQQAIVQAGMNRMRPIVMTTFAAILALLPLAIALGQGSEMQQPLAIAIISGLMIQIPLVLIMMPIIYKVLHRKNLTKS